MQVMNPPRRAFPPPPPPPPFTLTTFIPSPPKTQTRMQRVSWQSLVRSLKLIHVNAHHREICCHTGWLAGVYLLLQPGPADPPRHLHHEVSSLLYVWRRRGGVFLKHEDAHVPGDTMWLAGTCCLSPYPCHSHSARGPFTVNKQQPPTSKLAPLSPPLSALHTVP